MISQQLCNRFNNSINKIGAHPALPDSLFPINGEISYSLQAVCKNGFSESVKHFGVDIWYNEVNYKKYKKEFDAEFKKYPDEDKQWSRIHIPYIKYYGYHWQFSHVEYWGELPFYLFHGSNFKKCYDRLNWQSYRGVSCSAPSYEELIIKISKLFLKTFINKIGDDYLTPKEKSNHEKESPFKSDRKAKDGKGFYLDRNKNYIRVTSAEINRRWLVEFVKTDYCKKHWKNQFQSVLNGKEFDPYENSQQKKK